MVAGFGELDKSYAQKGRRQKAHLEELGIPHDQIRVVHADLPGADWPGTLDHVKRTTDHDVKVVI